MPRRRILGILVKHINSDYFCLSITPMGGNTVSLQINATYSDVELLNEIGVDGNKAVDLTKDLQVAIFLDDYIEIHSKGNSALQWTRYPVLEKNVERHNKYVTNHIEMNKILYAFRKTQEGSYIYLGEMKHVKTDIGRVDTSSGMKAIVTHTLAFSDNKVAQEVTSISNSEDMISTGVVTTLSSSTSPDESDTPKDAAKKADTKGMFSFLGCWNLIVIAAIVILTVYSIYNWAFKPKSDDASTANTDVTQPESIRLSDGSSQSSSRVTIDDFIPTLEKYPVKDVQISISGFEADDLFYPTVLYEAWLDTEIAPSKQYLDGLAKEIVSQYTARYQVNKIVIDLYKSKPTSNSYGGAYTLANITWAPPDESKYEVTLGVYSSHKYTITIGDSTIIAKELAYSKPSIPDPESPYEIMDKVFEDLSYPIPGTNSECVRVQYRVWIETEGKASRNAVQALARDLVGQVTKRFPINALSIFVYDSPDMYGSYTVASVDWAPYGDWGRADEVRTGDYSKHSYTINMR